MQEGAAGPFLPQELKPKPSVLLQFTVQPAAHALHPTLRQQPEMQTGTGIHGNFLAEA